MIDNDERERIRREAEANAARYWQYNTNEYDPRDVRHSTYNGDYKAAGGKN